MSDIRFKPWVGDKYAIGIVGYDADGKIIYGTENHIGKKVLVLGESHYCANPEAEATPFLTINIIADLLNPDSEWEAYKNTYTKFIKSLIGCEEYLTPQEKEKAWQHIVFYNYVQTPMSGARVAPTAEDFKNSEKAFFEVLQTYKPDFVIAWGNRLYNNLPQAGKQLNDLTIATGRFARNSTELWSYNVNGNNIPVMPITHPSAGYSIALFNSFFRELISK